MYIKKVFIADGDALIIPQKKLIPIVELIKNAFPNLSRIGSMAIQNRFSRNPLTN